jgi:hypothetical protein
MKMKKQTNEGDEEGWKWKGGAQTTEYDTNVLLVK